MSAKRYAMVIDTRTCVGCAACVIGCKTENDVADHFARDWIYTETNGSFPNLQMTIRSERCNHCEDAPCVSVCPTGASYYGPGGTVQVNQDKCSGCKACIAACPYDARLVMQSAKVNRAQAARDVQVARARASLLPDLPLTNATIDAAGSAGAAAQAVGQAGAARAGAAAGTNGGIR